MTYSLLDSCRAVVRTAVRQVAILLHRLTHGRVTANSITAVGLLMHVPIAWLIATGAFIPAAVLLVIFGLFDTLDGELARLQKTESSAGMLLDASTDRFKEVILYVGIAYYFITHNQAIVAAWVVAASGASLCVSYVKAKGETAVAGKGLTAAETNRLFQDGLMRFEVRMVLLVIGLVFNVLAPVAVIIALLAGFTALQRLISIRRKLNV